MVILPLLLLVNTTNLLSCVTLYRGPWILDVIIKEGDGQEILTDHRVNGYSRFTFLYPSPNSRSRLK